MKISIHDNKYIPGFGRLEKVLGVDHHGVVWCASGIILSEVTYNAFRETLQDLPPYESLPFFDNTQQNWVDVSE